jgi:D-threo-aldose 1-dehydrogenase
MDPHKRNRIGTTNVEVTCFGFGGAPLGERFVRVDNPTADLVVEAAYAAGINYFDTAPQYGQGKSESRLGRVLHTKPRETFILSTKVGHLFERPQDRAAFARSLKGNGFQFASHSDYTYDGVMRSYEHSLLRLGLNRVDVLVIHDIDEFHHGSREKVDLHFDELTKGGGWRALEELKRTGEVRAIGCGVNQLGTIPDILCRGEVDFFLVAMPYTLLDQGTLDKEFPLCTERKVSIVIGAVFASGILATGATETASYGYSPSSQTIKEKVVAISRICDEHGIPIQAAALQFPMHHSLVAAIIPGAYRPENIEDNHRNFRLSIPASLWSDLKSAGLLRPDAPTD